MHTPVGYMIVDGRFVPTDWLAVIFSPSFPYRFAHTVTAVYLTTAFTVIGVAAWYLLNNRFVEESRVMITMGVLLASILVPAQALIGDLHGRNTLEYQPQKLAAIEAIWDTRAGQPSVLFALPDEEYGVEPLRDRHSEVRKPLSHPQPRWHGEGPQGLPEGGPAAGDTAVLWFPHHGRDVGDHAGDDGLGVVARLAQASVHDARLFARRHLRASGGLRCGNRGLDDDRGRSATVRRVRAPAHR